MEIRFYYKETDMNLVYDRDGKLDYILDLKNNKRMMLEYTQIGKGYEFSDNNRFMKMDMCNAVYVRIMELDVFIPKFIFIPNNLK